MLHENGGNMDYFISVKKA